jgi:hypothetical protein
MRWLTSASVFHIEEPMGSYDCLRHLITPCMRRSSTAHSITQNHEAEQLLATQR